MNQGGISSDPGALLGFQADNCAMTPLTEIIRGSILGLGTSHTSGTQSMLSSVKALANCSLRISDFCFLSLIVFPLTLKSYTPTSSLFNVFI